MKSYNTVGVVNIYANSRKICEAYADAFIEGIYYMGRGGNLLNPLNKIYSVKKFEINDKQSGWLGSCYLLSFDILLKTNTFADLDNLLRKALSICYSKDLEYTCGKLSVSWYRGGTKMHSAVAEYSSVEDCRLI